MGQTRKKMTELTFQYASSADLHFLTTEKKCFKLWNYPFLKGEKKKVRYLLCPHLFLLSFLSELRIAHDGSQSYKSNWKWTLLGLKKYGSYGHFIKPIMYNYIYLILGKNASFPLRLSANTELLCHCDYSITHNIEMRLF